MDLTTPIGVVTDDPKRDKNYNWLTGAAMTQTNVEKLKHVTNNIIIDKKGAARVYLHEQAPRQLLVNESVLRRNKFYKQNSAAIQTTATGHMMPGGHHLHSTTGPMF